MVGYLRLFLAYLVLLSHSNVLIFGMSPGVFAVVTFYILSGYVVTRLWDEILPQGKGRMWRFYRDRALRIFPLYFYVCIIMVLFLLITDYGQPEFSTVKLLANFLIIPLNYFMWFDTAILTQPEWSLIPPAWSLGAEEQAYILMSILLVWRPLKYILVPVSIIVFFLAAMTILHPDYYGYRLLPGVFFIFVVGHSMCRIHCQRANLFDKYFPLLLWLLVASFGAYIVRYGNPYVFYIRETFCGLLFGIPVVYWINKYKFRLPGNALCGSLSYGLFLSHFPVICLLNYCGYDRLAVGIEGITFVILLTIISLLISWVGVRWVEVPVDRYRKKIT